MKQTKNPKFNPPVGNPRYVGVTVEGFNQLSFRPLSAEELEILKARCRKKD